MQNSFDQISIHISSNLDHFLIFKNQINKDLQRAGFHSVENENPVLFLKECAELLNAAIDENTAQLQTLYYLADVTERYLEHGIIVGFFKREWDKIQYRIAASKNFKD